MHINLLVAALLIFSSILYVIISVFVCLVLFFLILFIYLDMWKCPVSRRSVGQILKTDYVSFRISFICLKKTTLNWSFWWVNSFVLRKILIKKSIGKRIILRSEEKISNYFNWNGFFSSLNLVNSFLTQLFTVFFFCIVFYQYISYNFIFGSVLYVKRRRRKQKIKLTRHTFE